jgi:hypothetical protein
MSRMLQDISQYYQRLHYIYGGSTRHTRDTLTVRQTSHTSKEHSLHHGGAAQLVTGSSHAVRMLGAFSGREP